MFSIGIEVFMFASFLFMAYASITTGASGNR